MANLLPVLDARRPARSRSCTASRSSPATPATIRPGSRCAPFDDAGEASTAARLADWYRRFVETRSADAAERVLATALAASPAARRRRAHDVRGRHRPRVHRRRPHHRLHQQGVRGARPPRRRRRRRGAARRSCARPRRPRGRRRPARGATRTTSPRSSTRPQPAPRRRLDAGRHRGTARSTTSVAASAWQLLDDDPERGRRRACSTRSPPGPTPSSSAGPSPTPRRCASPASTCRTTTATGTRCTTRSPPPTRCTRRSCATPTPELLPRRRARRAARLPRPLPQRARGPPARRDDRRPRRARRVLGGAGRGRRGRQRSPTASCAAAATRRSSSPRSATRCCARTPSSTGTRCSRPASGSSTPWPAGSEEGALILAGVARFLAAHTPTRRELSRGRRHRHPPPPRRGALRSRAERMMRVTPVRHASVHAAKTISSRHLMPYVGSSTPCGDSTSSRCCREDRCCTPNVRSCRVVVTSRSEPSSSSGRCRVRAAAVCGGAGPPVGG